MSKAIPLDEQIVATLTQTCTAAQAAAVLDDAKRALRDLTKDADAADVASLSPLNTAAKARELRQTASDHRFEADRMEASVSALAARHGELKQAEASAQRDADRKAALSVRDELAAQIADRYPAIVAELTGLVQRIADCDRLCEVNGIGQSAEAIGRNIPANFYLGGGPVMRLREAKLPMPGSDRLAWEATMEGWTFRGAEAANA